MFCTRRTTGIHTGLHRKSTEHSFPLLTIKPGIGLAECIFGGEKRCLPWTINTTPSSEPGYCRIYGGSAPVSHGEFMLGVSIVMVDREIHHLVAWM